MPGLFKALGKSKQHQKIGSSTGHFMDTKLIHALLSRGVIALINGETLTGTWLHFLWCFGGQMLRRTPIRCCQGLAVAVLLWPSENIAGLGDDIGDTLNKGSKRVQNSSGTIAAEKLRGKVAAAAKARAQHAVASAISDSPYNHLFPILPDGRLWLGGVLQRDKLGAQVLEQIVGAKLPEDIYVILADRNAEAKFKSEANGRTALRRDLLVAAFGGPKLTLQQLVERNSYEYQLHPFDQFKQSDTVRAESPLYGRYLETAKALPLKVAWINTYNIPGQYDTQRHGFTLSNAGSAGIGPSGVEPNAAELNPNPFLEFDEAFARRCAEIETSPTTSGDRRTIRVMAYIEGQLRTDAVGNLVARISRITYHTVESTIAHGSKVGMQLVEMHKAKVLDFSDVVESTTAKGAGPVAGSASSVVHSRVDEPFDHLFAPLPNGHVWTGSVPRRGDLTEQILEGILGKSISSVALSSAPDYSKDQRLQHEFDVSGNLRAKLLALVGEGAEYSAEQLAKDFSGAYHSTRDEFERRDVLKQETVRFAKLVEKSKSELKDLAFTEFLTCAEYDFSRKGFPLTGGNVDLYVGTETFKRDFIALDESKAREIRQALRTNERNRLVTILHYGEGSFVTPKKRRNSAIQLTRSEFFFVIAEGTDSVWHVTRLERLSAKNFTASDGENVDPITRSR